MSKLGTPATPRFPNPADEPHIAASTCSLSSKVGIALEELEEAKRAANWFIVCRSLVWSSPTRVLRVERGVTRHVRTCHYLFRNFHSPRRVSLGLGSTATFSGLLDML